MATTTPVTSNSFSLPSIIAVAAAIGSFMTGAMWGLVLAVVAIVFGILGVILSLSPAKRGGIASTFGIAAGAVGIIAALIKGVMWMAG